MIDHNIIDEWGETYRVLAVDFAAQRVVAECGDDVTCWRCGFELLAGEWHSFDPGQTWLQPPATAAAKGGRRLGRREGRWFLRPTGPGLGPLRTWLLAQAERLEAEALSKSKASAALRQTLETPAAWKAAQVQLRVLDFDASLPAMILALASSTARLAAVASWLRSARGKLVHGDDLRLLFDRHGAPPIASAGLDAVVRPLMGLGLVVPYCYEPRPGTYVGESTGLRRGRVVPTTYEDDPETDYLFGAIYWYFRAGPRLRELPESDGAL